MPMSNPGGFLPSNIGGGYDPSRPGSLTNSNSPSNPPVASPTPTPATPNPTNMFGQTMVGGIPSNQMQNVQANAMNAPSWGSTSLTGYSHDLNSIAAQQMGGTSFNQGAFDKYWQNMFPSPGAYNATAANNTPFQPMVAGLRPGDPGYQAALQNALGTTNYDINRAGISGSFAPTAAGGMSFTAGGPSAATSTPTAATQPGTPQAMPQNALAGSAGPQNAPGGAGVGGNLGNLNLNPNAYAAANLGVGPQGNFGQPQNPSYGMGGFQNAMQSGPYGGGGGFGGFNQWGNPFQGNPYAYMTGQPNNYNQIFGSGMGSGFGGGYNPYGFGGGGGMGPGMFGGSSNWLPMSGMGGGFGGGMGAYGGFMGGMNPLGGNIGNFGGLAGLQNSMAYPQPMSYGMGGGMYY